MTKTSRPSLIDQVLESVSDVSQRVGFKNLPDSQEQPIDRFKSHIA